MRSRLLLAAFLTASFCAGHVSSVSADTPYPHIAPTEALTPQDELRTFKLPPGFEAQLVASEPDIRKPIQIAFDAKGRLWATTSEEYPFPARSRPGTDRLYVLDDFGVEGKAKKITVFADDLNIPIGVLPLPDGKSVIVSSIDPTVSKDGKLACWIWKLTDSDGDGKCDQKEKLYGPFGCDDTHGMNNSYTLMPDGWVYACHGFKNDSRPKGKDGHEIVMNSGNTFRFRPDGSRIELWTRGQVNPFGIAVDPYFNLYTADCHSKPITQLIRGATYQSFAKPHDGLGFAPHVTIHGHDSTALCGLVYYAADHFPKEYLDCMFLGNVTSNCINYDKIEFRGSTPIGIDKGMFLSSADRWFRPTDIKLGADGALYFADFYNRIIGHYEVDLKHPGRDKLRGRIWRIVYRGADGKGEIPAIVDLTKVPLDNLFQELGNKNLTVRLFATHEFSARSRSGGKWTSTSFADREAGDAHYKWATLPERGEQDAWIYLDSIFARTDMRASLSIVHLLRMTGALDQWLKEKHSKETARERVIDHLHDEDARVQRSAVEALIGHPSSENLRPLLALLNSISKNDDNLRYATRVALRETLMTLADWEKAREGKEWSQPDVRDLADIALAVPTVASSQFLLDHLNDLATTPDRLPAFVEHAVRYTAKPSMVFDFVKDFKSNDVRLALLLIQGYQQGLQKRGGRVSDEKAIALATDLCVSALASNDVSTIQTGIDLAAAMKLAPAFAPLDKLIQNKEGQLPQRIAALPALAALNPAKAVPILVMVVNDAKESIALREKAGQVLAGMNRAEALDELVKTLQAAPARLQTVIAQSLANNAAGAEKLLQAIESGKASARLLQDKTVQTRLKERKLPKSDERIAVLTKGLPSADDRLLKLLSQRHDGFAKAIPDLAAGKQVFIKNCAACHQIGNEGNKIGPQLDGIGGRGLDRLLEDILDPNRNVDAAFRTTVITMNDGKNISGLVLREEGQILVLADDKGKEIRLSKTEIEEKRQSLLSPMPSNLAETLAEKDFFDLMAYLLTQRAKDK